MAGPMPSLVPGNRSMTASAMTWAVGVAHRVERIVGVGVEQLVRRALLRCQVAQVVVRQRAGSVGVAGTVVVIVAQITTRSMRPPSRSTTYSSPSSPCPKETRLPTSEPTSVALAVPSATASAAGRAQILPLQ